MSKNTRPNACHFNLWSHKMRSFRFLFSTKLIEQNSFGCVCACMKPGEMESISANNSFNTEFIHLLMLPSLHLFHHPEPHRAQESFFLSGFSVQNADIRRIHYRRNCNPIFMSYIHFVSISLPHFHRK